MEVVDAGQQGTEQKLRPWICWLVDWGQVAESGSATPQARVGTPCTSGGLLISMASHPTYNQPDLADQQSQDQYSYISINSTEINCHADVVEGHV